MMRPENATTEIPLHDQAANALGRAGCDRIMFADDADGALAITYDRKGLVYVTTWYEADNDPYGWGGTAVLSRVEASTAERLMACEGHYATLEGALRAHLDIIDALVVPPDYALTRLTEVLQDLPAAWAARNDLREVRPIGGAE
jgi:hypothetical protein